MTKTLNDLYMQVRRIFKAGGVSSPYLEARELCAYAAGADRRNTVKWAFFYIDERTAARALVLAQRRLDGEPLAYLIGEWDFYGLTFRITADCLIPRSDTECLCDAAVSRAKQIVNPRVLDLCCGSGCIGVALAKAVDDARVLLADISDNCLALAEENAKSNLVSERAHVVKADALKEPEEKLGQFHIIVSNPPYIPSGDISGLDKSVRAFEPMLALDGGMDGLSFYRAIAAKWRDALLPGGMLLLECGRGQDADVMALLERAGFDAVSTVEDLSGVNRIVTGSAPYNIEQMLQFRQE